MEISPLGSNHSFPVFQQNYFKRQPNLRHIDGETFVNQLLTQLKQAKEA